MDAVSTLPESVAVLGGVPIRAECEVGSRTQQITRKHQYKTLDLRRHKSPMAMTTPGRPFCTITRKETARSAKTLGTPRSCWDANSTRLSKSFGGRLAQIPSNPGAELGRRAWSSAEEFDGGRCAHSGPEDKRAPSPRAVLAWGEGGGSGARWFSVKQFGKCFFLKSLLHLTVFKINRNGEKLCSVVKSLLDVEISR
jgi:hypothetical protein